jgi:hypothetical protein
MTLQTILVAKVSLCCIDFFFGNESVFLGRIYERTAKSRHSFFPNKKKVLQNAPELILKFQPRWLNFERVKCSRK